MTRDTPVYSLEECFAYLQSNAWQFPLLTPETPCLIHAQMVRSLYYHIGCVKFGRTLPDDIEQLGRDFAAQSKFNA